jgi:hypothetical protein
LETLRSSLIRSTARLADVPDPLNDGTQAPM